MLRKRIVNANFIFDANRDLPHDGFGSKGFTEQLNRVKSSGPGTMICRQIAKSEKPAGSERKSGILPGELLSEALDSRGDPQGI